MKFSIATVLVLAIILLSSWADAWVRHDLEGKCRQSSALGKTVTSGKDIKVTIEAEWNSPIIRAKCEYTGYGNFFVNKIHITHTPNYPDRYCRWSVWRWTDQKREDWSCEQSQCRNGKVLHSKCKAIRGSRCMKIRDVYGECPNTIADYKCKELMEVESDTLPVPTNCLYKKTAAKCDIKEITYPSDHPEEMSAYSNYLNFEKLLPTPSHKTKAEARDTYRMHKSDGSITKKDGEAVDRLICSGVFGTSQTDYIDTKVQWKVGRIHLKTGAAPKQGKGEDENCVYKFSDTLLLSGKIKDKLKGNEADFKIRCKVGGLEMAAYSVEVF